MPASEDYRRRAALLIRTIPLVAEEASFALKGGTAINLFVRDMPRLSVDIDLTCRSRTGPPPSRTSTQRCGGWRSVFSPAFAGAMVTEAKLSAEGVITKLFIKADGATIKIEVTPVLRGCIYDPETRSVSPAVEAEFGFAKIHVVSFADLYAGRQDVWIGIGARKRGNPRAPLVAFDNFRFYGCRGATLHSVAPVPAQSVYGRHVRVLLNFSANSERARGDSYRLCRKNFKIA